MTKTRTTRTRNRTRTNNNNTNTNNTNNTNKYKDILTNKISNSRDDIIIKKPIMPKIIIPNIPRNRYSHRHQNSKINIQNSYNTWEFIYFNHLIELKSIIDRYFSILDIDTNTYYFIDNFFQFIRECSSGEISNYIEPLNEDDEKLYYEFKRCKP